MSSSAAERTPPRIDRKVLIPALAGVTLLALAVVLRGVLTPVAVAFVLAYIAEPLLAGLERRRVRRWISVSVLYVVGLILMAVAGLTLGPSIGRQARSLYRDVAVLARDYGGTFLEFEKEDAAAKEESAPRKEAAVGGGQDTAGNAGQEDRAGLRTGGFGGGLPEWASGARSYLRTHADAIAGRVAGWTVMAGRNAAQGLSSAAGFIFGLLLVLVFTFFFMLHFREMVARLKAYIPAVHRERTLRIVRDIDAAVSNFFRGRLMVCVIAGIVYALGLRLSGIDFWLLIGLSAGLLGFVPIVGTMLPFIPSAAFALLTEHPWASLLGVLATFAVVQWIVEPVAGTLILSRQVKMHPVTIILALLIGGSLFGFFGVLLSVPLAAIAGILGREFLLPPLRELARQ